MSSSGKNLSPGQLLDRIHDGIRLGELHTDTMRQDVKALRMRLASYKGKSIDAGNFGDPETLKGLSLLSEYEYLNDNAEEARRWVVLAADSVVNELPKHPIPLDKRKIYRQQIWIVAAKAIALFRLGKNDEALELLDRAHRFVEDRLATADFPCYGTYARLMYFTGLLKRNTGQLEEAHRLFIRAAEMATLRRDWKLSRVASEKEERVERVFATRCLARLQAFGLGMTALCAGRLLDCRAHLSFALELLEGGTPRLDPSMVHEIKIHFALVQALLVRFDRRGGEEIVRARNTALNARDFFSHSTERGAESPYAILGRVTVAYINLRAEQMRQAGVDVPELSDDSAIRSNVASAAGLPDLIGILVSLLTVWMKLEGKAGQPSDDQETGELKALEKKVEDLPFFRGEVGLALVQSACRSGHLKHGLDLLRKILAKGLSPGQRDFGALLACELHWGLGNEEESIFQLSHVKARAAERFGYLSWRVSRAEEVIRAVRPDIPALSMRRLPMPYERGDRDMLLNETVAVFNATLDAISNAYAIDLTTSRLAQLLATTIDRFDTYAYAFRGVLPLRPRKLSDIAEKRFQAFEKYRSEVLASST